MQPSGGKGKGRESANIRRSSAIDPQRSANSTAREKAMQHKSPANLQRGCPAGHVLCRGRPLTAFSSSLTLRKLYLATSIVTFWVSKMITSYVFTNSWAVIQYHESLQYQVIKSGYKKQSKSVISNLKMCCPWNSTYLWTFSAAEPKKCCCTA